MGEEAFVPSLSDSPDEVVAISEEVAAFLPELSDEDVRGEVVLYRNEQGTLVVELVQRDGQVWLTQAQIAELYQTSRSVISKHLKNLYDEGEIVMQATCALFAQVQNEGSRAIERKIQYCNLEAILAVGYRVRSSQGARFRQWATQHLAEYLVKGFTMDDERLKNLGGGVYWTELLNRIRDIRASEKVFYRQVLDLFATSLDYDPDSDAQVEKKVRAEMEKYRERTKDELSRAERDSMAALASVGAAVKEVS